MEGIGLTVLVVLIVSFILSFLAVSLILRLSHNNKWFDHVNERKMHTGNIPRLAGIGFATAFLTVVVVFSILFRGAESNIRGLPCLLALLLILLFGMLDDFFPLKPRYKLLVQFVAALIVIFSGYTFKRIAYIDIGILPEPLGYVLTLLWIIGITNAVNLIDGIDGLAGSISGLIALSLGFIFLYNGNDPLLILYSAALVGVILGFLLFNAPMPKAKIFMGDCGSQFLGFSLALLPLMGSNSPQDNPAALPVLYAVALLLIPIFDIIAAVWRRIRDGVKIFSPDKSHVHHKLVDIGLGIRKGGTVLCILQVILGVLVFVSIRLSGLPALYVVGSAYIIVIAFFTAIHYIYWAALKGNRLQIPSHHNLDYDNDTKIKPASTLLRAILFRLPAPLIITAITILSSQSTLPGGAFFPGLDKFLHFIAYTALAAAVGLWFSGESWIKRPLRNFLLCIAVASVYGALDEFHQYFIPGRSCDFWDWVADTVGGAAGATMILVINRRFRQGIQISQ